MSRCTRSIVAVLALAFAACASSPAQAGRTAPRSDRNTLTAADLQASHSTNLYDVIRAQRPHWLTNGPAVYLDRSRLGGIDALRTMSVNGVASIRFLDAAAAQGEFGLDNINGAIVVSMNRANGP